MNYVVLVVPVLAFALSCYWSVQAWRSSPETWRTLNQRLRPKSRHRWPIYASLARRRSAHRALRVARPSVHTKGAVLFAFSAIEVFTGLHASHLLCGE